MLGRRYGFSSHEVNAMRPPYLEVTDRRGRPLAAYLYLDRAPGDQSSRSEQAGAGLIVDYRSAGKPIGIETAAPAQVSIAELNQVLERLHAPALKPEDVVPLCAA